MFAVSPGVGCMPAGPGSSDEVFESIGWPRGEEVPGARFTRARSILSLFHANSKLRQVKETSNFDDVAQRDSFFPDADNQNDIFIRPCLITVLL